MYFVVRWKLMYLYFDPRGGRAPAVSFMVIQVGTPPPALSSRGSHRCAHTAQKFVICVFGLTAGDN